MRRVLAALALLSVLASCSNASNTGGEGQSGIRGVVLAGPQCPVETAESPCPDQPVPGANVEVHSHGDVVAVATTDRRGRFSVIVGPGAYDVQATPGQQGIMSSKPVRVVVVDAAFADVTVTVDTGIR